MISTIETHKPVTETVANARNHWTKFVYGPPAATAVPIQEIPVLYNTDTSIEAILQAQKAEDTIVASRRNKQYDQAGLDELANRGLLVEGDFTQVRLLEVNETNVVFEKDNKKITRAVRTDMDTTALTINRGTKRFPEIWTMFIPLESADRVSFNPKRENPTI